MDIEQWAEEAKKEVSKWVHSYPRLNNTKSTKSLVAEELLHVAEKLFASIIVEGYELEGEVNVQAESVGGFRMSIVFPYGKIVEIDHLYGVYTDEYTGKQELVVLRPTHRDFLYVTTHTPEYPSWVAIDNDDNIVSLPQSSFINAIISLQYATQPKGESNG